MEDFKITPGVVLEVEKDKVLVELSPASGEGCGTTCKCSFMVGDKPAGVKVWIPVSESRKFQVQEHIWIKAYLPSAYLSILIVFLIPIVAILAGSILGQHIAAVYYSGNYDNILAAIGGATGFAISVLFAVIFEHFYHKKHAAFVFMEPHELEHIEFPEHSCPFMEERLNQ